MPRVYLSLGLETSRNGQEAMHELELCSANGRLVAGVACKRHGRQELFPIQGVNMQVRAEVHFDPGIEIFHLSIALRMSQGCFGVLDIQDGE